MGALKRSSIQRALHHKTTHPFPSERRTSPKMHSKTLYVLNLDHSRKYVGLTTDLHKRWHQHVSGHACHWTRRFKPRCVSLIRSVDARYAKEEEALLTAQLVLQHGVNCVRGANLTAATDYRRSGDDMQNVVDCLKVGLGMGDEEAWNVVERLFGTVQGVEVGEIGRGGEVTVSEEFWEGGKLVKRKSGTQRSHGVSCARCGAHRCHAARMKSQSFGSSCGSASLLQHSPAASYAYGGCNFSGGSGYGNEGCRTARHRCLRNGSNCHGSDNYSNSNSDYGRYGRGDYVRNEDETDDTSNAGFWQQSSVSDDYSQFQDLSSEESSGDWRVKSEYRGCTNDRRTASNSNLSEDICEGHRAPSSGVMEDGDSPRVFEESGRQDSIRDDNSSGGGHHHYEYEEEHSSQGGDSATENANQDNEYSSECNDRYASRDGREFEEEYSSGGDEPWNGNDRRAWSGISSREESCRRYSLVRSPKSDYCSDEDEESSKGQYSDDEVYSKHRNSGCVQDLGDGSFRSESSSGDYEGDGDTSIFEDWDDNSDYEDDLVDFW